MSKKLMNVVLVESRLSDEDIKYHDTYLIQTRRSSFIEISYSNICFQGLWTLRRIVRNAGLPVKANHS